MGLKSHMYLYTYKVLCLACIHNCTRKQQASIPAFKYFKASEKKMVATVSSSTSG